MNIIEELEYHEEDKLEDWIDTDEKIRRKFQKGLVKHSKYNLDEIRQYCINTMPTEFSSLSIIYEAFSEFSTDFNEFLFEEIQRVVNLARSQKIKPEYLAVLTDIETEDIYSKSEDLYIKIMDFLVANLKLENDKNFNIQLLEIIDWYLLDLDEDDEILESKNWINRIKQLADNSELGVKIKAREILEDSDISDSLKPLSLLEKITGIFK